MESLEYIEIDVPVCSLTYGTAPCTASIPTTGDIKCFNSLATCQDSANFDETTITLRFAKASDYLPREIDCIPSLLDVSFTPATISLGENLGTRATLSATFLDHPDSDTTGNSGFDKYLADRDYDPYSQGTFWGKFRARQPFLRGRSVRWITGLVGQDLAEMETRHFLIDSFDGLRPDGKYTILAKDVLKLADGDRSQAPVLSNGFLAADITISATSASLLPSGIGNLEYPASGFLSIGGNEVVSFTRSADALTIVRAQLGSVASAHKAQDRAQFVLQYISADVAEIVQDLLVTFSGVDSSYISMADWLTETSEFLGTVYTANICEPTSCATLISELVEQAALAIWDDNIEQHIRLKVLHGVLTDADTFTPDNTLAGTLTLKEQPEKRLSRVHVYFGQINPTKPLSNLDNYRSTSPTIDEEAEERYGSAAIKTILSRWIPQAGRSIADRLGGVLLGRYRDPPRRVGFSTSRYAETDVDLGEGYRVESFCIQDATGAQDQIPIQVTRVNPGPAQFLAEAEEMLFTAPDIDLTNRLVIIDADNLNINVRTSHDSIYPPAISGDTVTLRVNAGVVLGSSSTSVAALIIGSWPVGVIINVEVLGRVQGMGGQGGQGATSAVGGAGQLGGPALYTRFPINLFVASGQIFGGGGGGGGGAGGGIGGAHMGGGGGGGGGAGRNAGPGSPIGGGVYPMDRGENGTAGTSLVPGTGGARYPIPPPYRQGGFGANGGSMGLAGGAGGTTVDGAGGAGGAPGSAIDGISFVTVSTGPGDIRGPQVN